MYHIADILATTAGQVADESEEEARTLAKDARGLLTGAVEGLRGGSDTESLVDFLHQVNFLSGGSRLGAYFGKSSADFFHQCAVGANPSAAQYHRDRR